MRNDHVLASNNAFPPFAALRAFEAVFRTGGIRRAAADLGISHAVVSRHIRHLEDWLGEPLLERSGNRLTLTGIGNAYHQRISAALIEIVLATGEVRGRRDHGPLRLCCVPGLAIQWLSSQLAEFERQHPEFAVELKPTDMHANILLYEADVDIRYVRGDINQGNIAKGVRSFELARPEIMAVASPKVASRVNALGSVQRLLDKALLHEENQDEWRAWLTANRVAVPEDLPGPLCWHAHLAIDAARLGRGIALASRFLVNADLERGDLVEVAFADSHRVALGSYMLLAREDRWSLPAFATLRTYLRAKANSIASQ